MNARNSAVKRIMSEAKELSNDACPDYTAAPLEDDVFDWHCTIRGPAGTDYDGGIYHLRILLPSEYPFKAPSIILLTPNGRFELNTKICISFTNFHEELWQPAWGIRTAILGLQGFFTQPAIGLGSMDHPPSERRRLAAASRSWVCPHCQQSNVQILPDPEVGQGVPTSSEELAGPSAPSPAAVADPYPNSDATAPTALEVLPTIEPSAVPVLVPTPPPNPATVAPPLAAQRSTPLWTLDGFIGVLVVLLVAFLLRAL